MELALENIFAKNLNLGDRINEVNTRTGLWTSWSVRGVITKICYAEHCEKGDTLNDLKTVAKLGKGQPRIMLSDARLLKGVDDDAGNEWMDNSKEMIHSSVILHSLNEKILFFVRIILALKKAIKKDKSLLVLTSNTQKALTAASNMIDFVPGNKIRLGLSDQDLKILWYVSQGVKANGEGWKKIAELVGSDSGDSVRVRFNNVLKKLIGTGNPVTIYGYLYEMQNAGIHLPFDFDDVISKNFLEKNFPYDNFKKYGETTSEKD